MNNTICTYTGKAFNFNNFTADDICIQDIAHALSQLCRYTGHTSRFYSVAEHCVLLSRAEDMPGTPLARLLHDAVEAYVGDVSRPLKSLVPEHQWLEAKIQKVIQEKYEVDFEPVKPGDRIIVTSEICELMHHNFIAMSDALPPESSDITIRGWYPVTAKSEFTIRAKELGVTS